MIYVGSYVTLKTGVMTLKIQIFRTITFQNIFTQKTAVLN